MKVMFISDLHGSYYWANKAIEKYHEEKRKDDVIYIHASKTRIFYIMDHVMIYLRIIIVRRLLLY